MSDEIETVTSDDVTLHFHAKRCIHSRYCVLTRPDVFVPNVVGPWIHPEAARAEEVVALAHECPSGAIRYTRHDGVPDEAPPRVNLVRVRENGPLAVHADVALQRPDGSEEVGTRMTLCRCGASRNKPFCDGSHAGAGFTATGEPATVESTPLSERAGRVVIRPRPNGPLLVEGPLEVVSGTGRTMNRVTKTALCRCGQSANKPYCDGTHAKVGFSAE